MHYELIIYLLLGMYYDIGVVPNVMSMFKFDESHETYNPIKNARVTYTCLL